MKEKILTALLIINLIISGILIGSPIEQTHKPIIIATVIIFILYILISDNKIKIIRNKIDIFIMLLGASTLIPLIFNTAISITSEINYICKYISAILIYIMTREHTINYPKTRKYIINTIITLSLILIILGIDNMSTKIFEKPLELIDIKIEEIELNRLSSTFCYANSLAIVIGISIILNNANYINEDNKNKKSIYGAITTFLMMGLLLTYSRLVILIIGIFVIVNIMLLKNKQKRLDLVKLFIISTISAYIYSSIFFTIINSKQCLWIWMATAIISVANFFIIYYLIGIEKKLENVKIGKLIGITAIFFIIMIILVVNITGSLNIFKNNRKEYEIQLRSLLPNTNYTMKFEFGKIKLEENDENLTIKVIEMDKFFDEIYTTEIKEEDFIKDKQINITTQDITDKLKIVFTQKNEQAEIIINKLTLNDKNIVLDYKLIPDNLEHRIINTLMSNKGIDERIVFIEDGLKIAKDNWLFGRGANAWRYEKYDYQQYLYAVSQMHSYIVQVFIEYGIVAPISLITIIGLIVYKYLRNRNKVDDVVTGAFISLLALIVHSTIDLEMTYLYVLQLFFMLIAILVSYNIKQSEKEKTRVTKMIVAVILLIFLVLYVIVEPNYNFKLKMEKITTLNRKINKTEQEELEIIKNYNQYFKLEKVSTEYAYMYYNYAHVIQRNLTEENIEYVSDELDKLYYEIIKINPKYNAEAIEDKYRESKLVADKIKYSTIKNERLIRIQEKYYKIVIDGYKQAKNIIGENYRLCRISKEESERYVKELTEMYNQSMQEIENIKQQ